MKRHLIFLFIGFFCFVSCENNNKERLVLQEKEEAKKEMVFKKISESWRFKTLLISNDAEILLKNWAQWRLFVNELNQKPTYSLSAFQKKSKTLTKKSQELLESVPAEFSAPEFKSRFLVLQTKFQSLELYLNLNTIPPQKVIDLIQEINLQLNSIELQINEWARKKQIPLEQGEVDMIRMLDTSRAVREKPKNLD